MNIKFVTADLASYTDYRRLIDLACFEHISLDQIVDDGSVYIVAPVTDAVCNKIKEVCRLQYDLSTGVRNGRRSRFIYWMLERPALDPSKFLPVWDFLFDEIWHHDAVFTACGVKKMRLVRIGSDLRLKTKDGYEGCTLAGERSKYDFIHLCAPLGRRWHILHHLPGNTAPNAWHGERTENLRCSKFMLNVHQDDYFYMEPLRFALAAAYRLPLLTEELYPGNLHHLDACQRSYGLLLDTANDWVRMSLGHIEDHIPSPDFLFEKYCVDETFEKNVRKALA